MIMPISVASSAVRWKLTTASCLPMRILSVGVGATACGTVCSAVVCKRLGMRCRLLILSCRRMRNSIEIGLHLDYPVDIALTVVYARKVYDWDTTLCNLISRPPIRVDGWRSKRDSGTGVLNHRLRLLCLHSAEASYVTNSSRMAVFLRIR